MNTVKDMLLEYTSKKTKKNEISAQDVYEILRQEFPEFITQICEGYYQAGYKDASDEAERSGGKKKNKRHRKDGGLESELY